MKFRRWGITQKKAYKITQNLKVKRHNQIRAVKANVPRDKFRDVEVNEETGNRNDAAQAYLQC